VAEIGWLLIIVISFFFLSTQEAISQFPWFRLESDD
jgi:hypothetical protein